MNCFALLFILSCSIVAETQPPIIPPEVRISFDTGMGNAVIQYGIIDKQDREWFNFFRTLYERYSLNTIVPDERPRIPKIIHQIWLGGPVPNEYKMWMRSWQTMHPEWVYCLWTDENTKNLSLINQKLFDQARNYGQKSDILRYELLYRFGGLYLDVDFRCLKQFDIFHHCYDFYIGIINAGTAELAIGLIGSVPNHPILAHVIESMHQVNSDDPEAILETTGNFHFLRSFMDIAPHTDSRIIAFPCTFFYPSPNSDRFLTPEQQDKWIKPESFAIHYWGCSWQRPEAVVKQRLMRLFKRYHE